MPETFLARFPGDPRGTFSSLLRRSWLPPTAEDVSAFGQHRKFPRTQEKPLVPRVRRASRTWHSRNWLSIYIHFLEREGKQANWSWANDSSVKDSAHYMLKAMLQKKPLLQGRSSKSMTKLEKKMIFFFYYNDTSCYSMSFNLSNLGEFFWSWIWKGCSHYIG